MWLIKTSQLGLNTLKSLTLCMHIVHSLISLNYHLLQKTVSLIEVKSIGTAIFNQELFYCYYILVGLYSSDGFRCRFHLIKWVSNTVKK